MTVNLNPYVLELAISRVCHDVVSPVGAISNGVELVEELGLDAGGEALDLISKSAEQANRRLKIFRLCYGAAGSNEKADIRQVRSAIMDYFQGTRAVVEWPENDSLLETDLPKGFQKCVMNLILLAGEMVTKGGVIKVQKVVDSSDLAAIVTVDGDGVGFREGQRAALDGTINETDLDPRLVHAFLTGRFAQTFGHKIEVEIMGESKFRFRLNSVR